ncbi:tyrosine-type recombinase/integrase [Cytobacillus sp. Sa5YUA1]|uniref:Tyrosine-type recombinase/integrase n=1 Tax=Cytobacillus stercorigallinarum TaxID=2762240 RepID=A0ABR8QW28_9BACI|nr:tyrosine-type recombinase/integrase [Cytobacillus stercorigallinarum]MBD7939659.1 tyrosine-type recombinase/integrase [Cytobacillus stercorigallinarum]
MKKGGRKPGAKDPIRSLEKIDEIKEWLLRHSSYRNYFLFYFGINTGLRISDILRLRVKDVRGKDVTKIKMKKTEHTVEIYFNVVLQREIDKYTQRMADSDWLFPSREGEKTISRQMADKILRDAALGCGINQEAWGTHSMRKTFGYHYYQRTKDVYYLMKLFGHTTQSQTLQYIGIESDEIRKTMENFTL